MDRCVIPSTFSSLLFISQIIVGIYLLSDVSQNEIVAYAGVGLYIFSGWIFGMLSMVDFRKKGGVKKGKSYIHTKKLVDTGIYSIVRHPQYVTFILFAIAGMLLFQHWIIILLGIPIIPLTYIDLLRADKRLIEKFGDEYKKYMQKVPRANFLLGIIRLLLDGFAQIISFAQKRLILHKNSFYITLLYRENIKHVSIRVRHIYIYISQNGVLHPKLRNIICLMDVRTIEFSTSTYFYEEF